MTPQERDLEALVRAQVQLTAKLPRIERHMTAAHGKLDQIIAALSTPADPRRDA